ncbi:MAG: rhodanese-like domain-containing protein [Bacteroidaceae bacterium]|nr:rhodanese-like domain-containing protein [Bacteroidaceae bacterium]
MKHLLSLLLAATSLVGCQSDAAFKSVDAQQFAEVITNQDVQLVDARTPEEFSEVHIPGAVNIDVKSDNFDAQIATLNPARPVAVYCRSGRRSKLAAERMTNAGLQVTELAEGILSWKGEVVK